MGIEYVPSSYCLGQYPVLMAGNDVFEAVFSVFLVLKWA